MLTKFCCGLVFDRLLGLSLGLVEVLVLYEVGLGLDLVLFLLKNNAEVNKCVIESEGFNATCSL